MSSRPWPRRGIRDSTNIFGTNFVLNGPFRFDTDQKRPFMRQQVGDKGENEWAYNIANNAMLLAGRAGIFSEGYAVCPSSRMTRLPGCHAQSCRPCARGHRPMPAPPRGSEAAAGPARGSPTAGMHP